MYMYIIIYIIHARIYNLCIIGYIHINVLQFLISACHDDCTNNGFGGCTGSGNDDCCSYFDSSGSCVDSCMKNFAPNEEYTCGELLL